MADKKAAKKAVKSKTAKKAERAQRTKMSEAQVDQFIKHFAKAHDLTGKALDSKLRHVAATRLAALERWQKQHAA